MPTYTQTQNSDVFLYRVGGSSAAETVNGARFVEMAFVINVEAASSPAAAKLRALAKPGIPKVGQPHGGQPNAICVDRKASPVGDGTQAWIELVYETNTGSLPGEQWVVTQGGVLANQTYHLHPDTWERLRVVWQDAAGRAVGVGPVFDETAGITIGRPVESLTAEGEVRGRVPKEWSECAGTVNSVTFRNRDKGFWLCLPLETQTRTRGSSYAVKVTFLSRVQIDWSEYALCTDPLTGKIMPVSPAEALAMRREPYNYNSGRPDVGNGITKVCPYKEVNYAAVFRNIPFSV